MMHRIANRLGRGSQALTTRNASAQVPNLARRRAIPVDDWIRIESFLVLGSDGRPRRGGEVAPPDVARPKH